MKVFSRRLWAKARDRAKLNGTRSLFQSGAPVRIAGINAFLKNKERKARAINAFKIRVAIRVDQVQASLHSRCRADDAS